MYCFVKDQHNRHVCLGEGSSGRVKLAMDIEHGHLVAIKTIYEKSTVAEISIHSQLDHPNIVKLLNSQTEPGHRKTVLVMEYVNGGNLKNSILERSLSREDIQHIFRQVCESVLYVHSKGIIHGDIKPENILLTKENCPKLCDFGSGTHFGSRRSLHCTMDYMSPEAALNLPQDYHVDIWSLGILLYEMIAGHTPFQALTKEQLIKEMKKSLPFAKEFDSVSIDLIKKMLRVNPENRLKLTEILNHHFFLESNDEKVSYTVSTVCSPFGDFQETPTKLMKSMIMVQESRKRQRRLQSEDLGAEI